MDFRLTEEQRQQKDTVRTLAEKVFKSSEGLWEADKEYVHVALRRLADNGLLGLNLSPEYGGLGLSTLDSALCIEEMSKVSPQAGALMASASLGQAYYIQLLAPKHLKETYLPAVCRGDGSVSIGISEPGAGSAATGMTTSARIEGNRVIVNGHKHYVGGAPHALAFVVYARMNDAPRGGAIGAVLVPADANGFKIERLSRNMAGNYQADLRFEECSLPIDHILAGPGAFGKLTHIYNLERVGASAGLLGAATGAFERTLDYVQLREQFGKPLIDFQAVQLRIADMAMHLDAARLMVYRVLSQSADGMPSPLDSSMAKVFVNETARMVTDNAIQLHGAAGYLQDTGIERIYRIVRGYSIAGGPLDLHKSMIAGQLVGRRFSQWSK
jgi:alkylation response protein AidB-like acyl-CoA dehydrogenase